MELSGRTFMHPGPDGALCPRGEGTGKRAALLLGRPVRDGEIRPGSPGTPGLSP